MDDRGERVLWTEEHLLALPDIGYKTEVVDGRLTMMAPAGGGHGNYSVRMTAALLAFVESHQLGVVFDSSTGFVLTPDDILSPDGSFVSFARLKAMGGVPTGFIPGAPDLAIEVLSPSERSRAVAAKVAKYLAHGSKLIWVVDPKTKSVTSHRPNQRPSKTTTTLTAPELLPGFKLPVKNIFRTPKF